MHQGAVRVHLPFATPALIDRTEVLNEKKNSPHSVQYMHKFGSDVTYPSASDIGMLTCANSYKLYPSLSHSKPQVAGHGETIAPTASLCDLCAHSTKYHKLR